MTKIGAAVGGFDFGAGDLAAAPCEAAARAGIRRHRARRCRCAMRYSSRLAQRACRASTMSPSSGTFPCSAALQITSRSLRSNMHRPCDMLSSATRMRRLSVRSALRAHSRTRSASTASAAARPAQADAAESAEQAAGKQAAPISADQAPIARSCESGSCLAMVGVRIGADGIPQPVVLQLIAAFRG